MQANRSASRQRWLAFALPALAALAAVAAFYVARACGCDERQVSLVTMVAGGLTIMALAVAR